MPKCTGKIITLNENEQGIILDALNMYLDACIEEADENSKIDIDIINNLIPKIDSPLDEWCE